MGFWVRACDRSAASVSQVWPGTRRGPEPGMQFRTLVFLLTPMFVAPLAHAQAPGEGAAQSVVAAPAIAQPVVVAAPMAGAPSATAVAQPPVVRDAGDAAPCVGCRTPVMANRWSIGLSVGSLGLAPKGSPDSQTDFAVGELALRFRAAPHLELEVASDGGQESNDNRTDYLRINTVRLAARYRFMPDAAWNWFVMGGVGAAAIAVHNATDQERRDAIQPLGMLGIGVERRFDHLALQAELRGIGLGKRTDTTTADNPVMTTPMSTATTTVPAQSGGSISIGLSYYF